MKAIKLKYLFLAALLLTSPLYAQFTTPTINGVFDGASIYPTNLGSDGRTWYMTWDNTNLYVFVQGAGLGNRVLLYFDTNIDLPVNGGTNGSVNGINYSNTNLVTLPFRAEAFVAIETGYRQLNTCFTGTVFSVESNVTAAPGWAFGESGGNFEIQIPWNALTNGAGRPAAFNWCGYITDNNVGGNYFSRMPTENPGGVLGLTLPNATNTAGFERYFKVTNTNNGTSTSPFSQNCYTFVRHTGVDATGFGAITVVDFTMNTGARSIVRGATGAWVITGDLIIENGTVNFDNSNSTCGVSGNVRIGANGSLLLSNSFGGDLLIARDFIFNGSITPRERIITLNGNAKQTISGSTGTLNMYSLTVTNPDTIVLSRDIQLVDFSLTYGTVTLGGVFVTTTNGFLSPGGTGSGTTVNINGTFRVGNQNGLQDPSNAAFQVTRINLVLGSASVIEYNATTAQRVTARSDYNILRINNTGGNSSFTPPTTFVYNNPTRVDGNLTADSLEVLRGLFMLAPDGGTGGTYTHTFNAIVLGGVGSATSGSPLTPPIVNNTVLILNNRTGATVNVTINGNFVTGSGATGVEFTGGGKDGLSSTGVTFTVGGDFSTTSPSTLLAWSGALGPVNGTFLYDFKGNVSLNAASLFNGDRFGISPTKPTIRFSGTSSTFSVPRGMWLSTFSTSGATNALNNWEIASGTTVTVPNGSAIVVNNGRTLTLNGTIELQGDAALIGTTTGNASGNPTLTMGASGLLRFPSPGGLGTGADSNATATSPPTTPPAIYLQRAFGTGFEIRPWILTSLNNNGTIEYNGNVAQTVTARNGAETYRNLIFSGTGTKTMAGNIDLAASSSLTLNSGAALSTSTHRILFAASGSAVLNGTFITGNTNGFTGGASTAISSTNSPTVTLGTTSTVEYQGNGTLTGGRTYYTLRVASGNRTVAGGDIGILGDGDVTVDGLCDMQGSQILFSDPGNSVTINGHFRTERVDGFTGVSTAAISSTNSPTVTLGSASVVEYSGADQTLTARSDYATVNISGSGDKTMNGDVTIGVGLNLGGGFIVTGSNVLRFLQNAFSEDGSDASHVIGTIEHTYGTTAVSKSFPLGDGNRVRGLALRGQAVSGTASVTGRIIPLSAGGGTLTGGLQRLSALRFFRFDVATNDMSFTQVETFSLNPDDDATASADNTTLRIVTQVGSDWIPKTIPSPVNTSTTPTTFDSDIFTPEVITVGSAYNIAWGTTSLIGDDPLPVELGSFTAISLREGNELRWETKSEHESFGFLLHRKRGNGQWERVGTYVTHEALRAHNRTTGATYTFLDAVETEQGELFTYRLEEVGFNGVLEVLREITVESRFSTRIENFVIAQNTPNPFNPQTRIRYQLPEAADVTLEVYDILGKRVATLAKGKQVSGEYAVSFNGNGLASGVYFYRFVASTAKSTFARTIKMTLLK